MPENVSLVDQNNNPVSVGGGTQYTDGAAPPANPIAGALLFDNSGTWVDVGVDHPLPITGTISASNPSVGTDGNPIPASSTLIGGSDGTNLQPLQVDGSKNLKVNVAAGGNANGQATMANSAPVVIASDQSKLPTKAASGDFTAGAIADLATLLTLSGTPTDANTANSLIGRLTKIRDLLSATLTVSGTVTEANSASIKVDLDTLVTNTADLLADGDNLATINTNTANIPAKGTAVMTSSAPVTIATDDTQMTAIKNSVANILAKGQATMANSSPIVLASDQVPVPIKRSTVAVYTLASTATSGSTQNSGDLTVGAYTEISIDINTTAQSGTSPTLQLFYERKGADGIYYVLWQSAVLTVAANTISTSIGAGMAYNQSLALTGRLRWVVGGSATPTYTFSANIYGR